MMFALQNITRLPAFTRALGVMGSAEAVNRLTRIGTAVVLAWALSPQEFGIVALALTTTEILQAFFVSGLGAKIIQTPGKRLEAICNAAYRLNRLAYMIVFAAQIIAAYAIGGFFENEVVTQLIAALAIPLIVYPLSTVQVYRVQRAGRMKTTAKMLAARFGFENLATIVFALAGMGVWSVVLPRLICAPIWVYVYRRLDDWRPGKLPNRIYLRDTATFGGTVLIGELVQALRLHSDKFIVGHFLGLELLGVYYFAFNAGLGITTGLVTAFSTALLPHICNKLNRHELAATWRKALGTIYVITGPIMLAQIILAPIYVPLVFGAKWQEAAPLVMMLCISGLVLPMWRATGQLLKAIGKPHLELVWVAIHAVLGITATIGCASYGLQAIAIGLTIVNFTVVPLATAWAYRYIQPTMQHRSSVA